MTEKTLTTTADLGQDWFANLWSDGSATIRNSEKGQRIDLPVESVETFRKILNVAMVELVDAARASRALQAIDRAGR
jgi:hypothetical protein